MNPDIVLGLQVTVIGFGIVIVALFILYLLIHGLGRFLNPEAYMASKPSSMDKTAAEVSEVDETSVEEESTSKEESQVETGELDPAIIAVISASIAMMLGTTEKGFRIKSIRPIKRDEELSYWTISGREELMKPHHETI